MPKQLSFKGHEFAPSWRETLELAARTCSVQRRVKLFCATFITESPAPKIIAGYNLPLTLEKKDDYWVASLRSSAKERGASMQFGLFSLGSNCWTAFTLAETIATENRLLRLLRSLAPDFSKAYLSSTDIRHVFDQFEQDQSVEIFVNKAVAYSHRREGQISFKKEPYHVVFNRAENEGMFVDKVDFTIGSKGFLHAFIARNGVAKFLNGQMGVFLDIVLGGIVATASGIHKVFRQSSRKPGEIDVSPVDIDFGQTVFNDRNDNLAFLSALDFMSRSGIAVLHENPYVHVSLIDFFDGSSFDIFATSPGVVTIIPQVGASAFSMNRLCNHIFESFREGRVVTPQPRRWTLEDVLA